MFHVYCWYEHDQGYVCVKSVDTLSEVKELMEAHPDSDVCYFAW